MRNISRNTPQNEENTMSTKTIEDIGVGTGKIKRMDQNLQSRKKFTPMKMRAMSINTDRSLDLSEITEISVSANEGSVKETMIKLTQQQVMNNYLATCLYQRNAFILLENIIIELTRIFEYVAHPSIYACDIDLVACLKEYGVLQK